MRRDIKNEILTVSRELFGELGYNNVTMRHISDELGISVGNLTYHYKKKEELVEAVILEQHKHYKRFELMKSLKELNVFLEHVSRHQKENAYYFRHYAQLAQISPKVYEIQVEVMSHQCQLLGSSLEYLQKEGYIRPDLQKGQLAGIVQALIMVKVYWISWSDIAPAADTGNGPMNCLWSILYPVLTEKGIQEFEEAVKI